MKRCLICIWFDNHHFSLQEAQNEYDNCGYCRKHKPMTIGRDGRIYGTWPIVGPQDFCGEFRLKESETQ